MIATPMRRRLSGGLDGTLGSPDGQAGSDAAPGAPAPMGGAIARRRPLRPAAAAIHRAPVADATMSAEGAAQPGADPGNSAAAISQLPDGNGGTVAVPPLSLAPPSAPSDATPWAPVSPATLPASPAPAPAAAAAPAAPWDPAAGRFDATHNAIDSVIQPGAGDPSRIDLATRYGTIYDQATRPQYEHDITDATDAAAAHGRLGSGILTNRYGDLFTQRQNAKDALEATLRTNAVEGTIADQRSNRGELRTERGYQSSKAAEALAARIAQQQAESGDTQQAFDNAMRTYGLGASSDPSAALLGASGRASAESASGASGVNELLKLIMLMRGQSALTA